MTTIAFREGIMAADSGATYGSEAGGDRKAACRKLYRKVIEYVDRPEVIATEPKTTGGGTAGVPAVTHKEDVLIGTAGESAPGLLYLDLVGTVPRTDTERWDELREILTYGEADFSVLILTSDGLFEVDKWLREEKVIEPFWAIGSGAKVALGAMQHGASAREAVVASKVWDPYTFGPTVSASLWFGSSVAGNVKLLGDVSPGTIIEIQAETA